MRNESIEMQEIHRIREQIYEETKGMSLNEKTNYFNKNAADFIKQYGLNVNILKSSSQTDMEQAI
ncbi:MAG: hypothetical protein LBN34_01520 [Clostridiales Family XIII bacterium]|jgi:hypothetical protein|nr:hypothetical protein [Clostridiales Family XIII bacterium]